MEDKKKTKMQLINELENLRKQNTELKEKVTEFSHGTLAVNSIESNAFSEDDIVIPKEMAPALSGGFLCREDLKNLERYTGEREDEIAEHKRLKKALAESEEHFQVVLKNSPVIVFNQDKDLRYTWMYNPGPGFSVESVLGKTDKEILSPEDAARLTEIKSRVLKTGTGAREEAVVTINGETSFYDLTVEPLFDSTDMISGITCAAWNITELKKSEEALLESEKRFKAQYQGSLINIFTWQKKGEDFILVDYKNAANVSTNGEVRKYIGKSTNEIYRNREDIVQDIHRCFVEKTVINREIKSMHFFPGKLIVIDFVYVPPDMVMVFAEDITECRRAEEALRESEEKYRRVIETANEAIFVAQESKLKLVNDKLERITGYSREELESRPFIEFIYPDDQAMIDENYRQRLSGGTLPSVYPFRFIDKNGAVRWAELSATLLNWEGKQATLNVLTDITERNETEKALRESEERYRFLYEQIPDLYLSLNTDEVIIECGSLGAQRLGYSSEKLIGRHIKSLLTEESIRDFNKNFPKLLEHGKINNAEKSLITKSGEIRDFILHIEADYDADGNPLGTRAIFHDITEQKKVNEQLLSYQNKLRSLASELIHTEDRERKRIAEYLHDQIGQSLVVIRMKLGELKRLVDSRNKIELIDETRDLISRTIEDTRLVTFELSPPVLYELGFESAIEWNCEKISKDYDIEIKYRNDKHRKPVSDDISAYLYHMVSELLMNIVKHAQACSGKVTIRRVGKFVCITVEDNGIGFDRKTMEHPNLYRGFGLFSISERIEHINGRVEIESEPGHGTCITLFAPLKKDDSSKRGNNP